MSALPRLVLVADRFTDPDVADRVVRAAEAGVPWVQLRDHGAEACSLGVATGDLVRRLRKVSPGILISMNSHPELVGAGVDGVHVGTRGPSVGEVRRIAGPQVLLGYSAHTLEDARSAAEAGADYVFFSPVYTTSSKPGTPAAGLDALSHCVSTVSVPVFALGGITPERIPDCLRAGAYGVAVISGILATPLVDTAVEAFLRTLTASE